MDDDMYDRRETVEVVAYMIAAGLLIFILVV